MSRPVISIVGAGRLAQALAPALRAAGYTIAEIIARSLSSSRQRAQRLARRVGARASTSLETAGQSADLIWLCVTDDAVSQVAESLAAMAAREWRKKIVLHSSGALTSHALDPLRRRGASAASVHPMMTFTAGRAPSLAGVSFALEGDRTAVARARRIVRDLGGSSFILRPESKPLYHATGSFSSPMVIATVATAEQVARAAGLSPARARRLIAPILRQTLDNYLASGAQAAFTGPVERGDVATIRRHLEALKAVPAAREAYVALARSAVTGLKTRNRNPVLRLLDADTRPRRRK